MAKADRKNYVLPSSARYENTVCCNYFHLENGENSVTIFFQPVIYSEDKRDITEIGLYRNTSIGLAREEESYYSSRGLKYYTPDYLIKYESGERKGAKYLIADAKFSRIKTVKSKEVSKLVFKYLFSVTPFDKDDEIVGLCIMNGQSDKDLDGLTNIYEFGPDPSAIRPRAEILTLTENSEDNRDLHRVLMRDVLGRYEGALEKHYNYALEPRNTETALKKDEVIKPEPESEYKIISTFTVIPPEDTRKKQKETPVSERETSDEKALKLPHSRETKVIDKKAIKISELSFKREQKGLREFLSVAGIETVGDLVPNFSEEDLNQIPGMNRERRRQIKAVLKEKRIVLK